MKMNLIKTLSKEDYHLLKRKAIEEKIDNKIFSRGAIWNRNLDIFEESDIFFVSEGDNGLYEVPANVQIATTWKAYEFPYKQVSIKAPPDGINHLVLVNLPLTRCMVIPKPINEEFLVQTTMYNFDDTTIKSVATQVGKDKLIIDLDKVMFLDL